MENIFRDISSSISGIIKALLFLVVALITAGIIKLIVTSLLKRILPQKLKEKNPDFFKSIISFTARIFYFIVFLLFIPGIFSFMGMEAAADPIIKMLESMVMFIPNIIVAILIIYIGVELSKLCGSMVKGLISSIKLKEYASKIIPIENKEIPVAKFCSVITELLVAVIFAIQAVEVLNLKIFDGIGSTIISYVPHIIAAVIVLIGCFILDALIGRELVKVGCTELSLLMKIMIYTIGVFMILSQLKIAEMLVNWTFIIIVSAVAIAFAISFGIGGRDFAHRVLDRFDSYLNSEKLIKEKKKKDYKEYKL